MLGVRRLYLELGYFCNVHCVMCYQQDYVKKMPDAIWKKKLLPVYKGLDQLVIQGGELTAMPEARELISLVKKQNKKVKFGAVTNGLLFDDYWQNEWVKNGFSVSFSLNAATEATYNKVCKGSNYKKVMENLKSVLKKRRENKKSQLGVSISMVVIPENVVEMADLIRLGKKLGVSRVRFFVCVGSNHPLYMDRRLVEASVGEAWRAFDEAKIEVEGLARFYEHYCLENRVKNVYSEKKDTSLMADHCDLCWVGHNGEVRPCCPSTMVWGNLNEDCVEDVWVDSKIQQFKKSLAAGDFRYCDPLCPLVKKPKFGFDVRRAVLGWQTFWNKLKNDPKKALKMAWGHKRWWLVVMGIMNVVIRLHWANAPAYHDETFYFNGARKVLENYLIPWVNFSGYKGPVVYEPVALMMGFLGVCRWWARILIYLCSSISVWLVYKLGKRLFGEGVGLTTAGLVAIMPLFVIHSFWYTDAVPLLMVTLLTLNYYFEGRMFKYFLCSILLVLTKETAIFVPLFLALYGGQWLVAIVPAIGFGVWMMVNKIVLGFYLSPGSVGLIWSQGWQQRWWMGLFNWGTLFWLLAVVITVWQRKKINVKLVSLFLGMYFFYNVIYGITYFNQRYLLFVIPLPIMALVYLLRVLGGRKMMRVGVITMALAMTLTQIWQWQWGKVEDGGNDLRVWKIISLQKEVATYLSDNYPDKRVLTGWPLASYISDPFLGYVKKPMTVVTDNSAQLVVTSAVNLDMGTSLGTGWKLIKSWQSGAVDVYEK